MEERVYRVARSTITIRFGDITTSKAEVLVSSDDGGLSHGGGVSRALYLAAGGQAMDGEYAKLVPVPAGQVVVTSAGKLAAKYICHAITIDPKTWALPEGTVVRQLTRRVMEMLPLLGCRHVAFPSIGSGVAGVSAEDVAAEMGGVLVRALLGSDEEYRVELYLNPQRDHDARKRLLEVFDEHIRRGLGLLAHAHTADVVLEAPQQATRIETRQEQVYAMLAHLDARRDQLESVLIKSPVDGDNGEALAELHRQLSYLRELRRGYEEEAGIARSLADVRPKSVFVSSTLSDLRPHRQAMRDVLKRLDLHFIGMEEFQPAGMLPADYIRDRVEEAEVYLGIVGLRYGSIDPVSGFSMTELEYRQAVASKKERYIFSLDDGAPISLSMVEQDLDGLAKLLGFRQMVLRANVVKFFRTVEDLVNVAEETLLTHLGHRSAST